MHELSKIERQVLEKLLSGEHPALEALRAQLQRCLVPRRELTGVGFMTELEVDSNAPRAPLGDGTVRLGDVIADLVGVRNGAGFLLYIRGGYLDALEGYTFDEEWPQDPQASELRYTPGEPRDLSALG